MAKEAWGHDGIDWDVYIRDKCRCVYCGLNGRRSIRVWNQLVIDHLVPETAGGLSTPDNMVVACYRCNTLKGRKNPLRANRLAAAQRPKFPLSSRTRARLIQRARDLIRLAPNARDQRSDYNQMLHELGAH